MEQKNLLTTQKTQNPHYELKIIKKNSVKAPPV